MSIKRVPNTEILNAVHEQIGRPITERYLNMVRQQIKKESFHWYSKLREGEYEYLHEYKERINEIMDLQNKTHQLFDNNKDNPSIQLEAIAELRRLNEVLSNYYSVAPSIGNVVINSNDSLSTISEKPRYTEDNAIV